MSETVTSHNITSVEIGLINACVLSCPMCLRLEAHGQRIKPNVYVAIENLIEKFDGMKNLNRVDLVGSVSEPTLYPDFIDLVKYLKGREIGIRLSTNGNTKGQKFWRKISSLFDSKDIIRFAVDGSSQELHSRYRVGGSLEKVLGNHRIFKEMSEAKTILQNIIFEYNKDDRSNIEQLFLAQGFDYLEFIESGECADLKNVALKTDVVPRRELRERFDNHDQYVMNKKIERMDCLCVSRSQVYINHLGVILPCDDMEEMSFLDSLEKNELPNIYENSLEECLEFVNLLISRRYCNSTCIRCCSKSAVEIKRDYPVMQCGKSLEFKELREFRGTV